MKTLNIFACVSLLTIIGTVANAQSSSSTRFPGSFSNYPIINYYCYLITNSGYVENLEPLCRGQEEPPAPPEPPVILSNGDLSCSFVGSLRRSSASGTGSTISIPAACIALRTTDDASVRAQLKSGNRVLDTNTELISYIEAGETYYYDADFTSDYASGADESLSIRFIP